MINLEDTRTQLVKFMWYDCAVLTVRHLNDVILYDQVDDLPCAQQSNLITDFVISMRVVYLLPFADETAYTDFTSRIHLLNDHIQARRMESLFILRRAAYMTHSGQDSIIDFCFIKFSSMMPHSHTHTHTPIYTLNRVQSKGYVCVWDGK